MAIKHVPIEERNINIYKNLMSISNKQEMINAALIILRRTQLDLINSNQGMRDKMLKLNAEFKQKSTFKLLNIVNLWMKGR